MQQTHGTWGRRIVTREDCHSVTTILYLKPNKRCSWHSHNHAYNQFFVIKGELSVKTDIGPDNQRNVTTLSEGQFFTVQPGVTHEFRTGSADTIIEEVAYVEFDKSDIHRKQLGGDITIRGVSAELKRKYKDTHHILNCLHCSKVGTLTNKTDGDFYKCLYCGEIMTGMEAEKILKRS